MKNSARTCDVTVVIPTFQRAAPLENVILRIGQCVPCPSEIIVHVDFGDKETAGVLESNHPAVRVLKSDCSVGPGGGRNSLMREASFECVVSLDDDSWPERSDFFSSALQVLEMYPKSAVFACQIRERDEEVASLPSGDLSCYPVASFVGCGAVIRRSAFLKTEGYLPLRYAYGMEELDVSLQLLNLGYEIRACSDLQVYHDCDRANHHANAHINAAQIRNTALLAFLRYPTRDLPLGILQTANRVAFSVRKRRWTGIVGGILSIPGTMWKYRKYRHPMTSQAFRHFIRLRKACQKQAFGG